MPEIRNSGDCPSDSLQIQSLTPIDFVTTGEFWHLQGGGLSLRRPGSLFGGGARAGSLALHAAHSYPPNRNAATCCAPWLLAWSGCALVRALFRAACIAFPPACTTKPFTWISGLATCLSRWAAWLTKPVACFAGWAGQPREAARQPHLFLRPLRETGRPLREPDHPLRVPHHPLREFHRLPREASRPHHEAGRQPREASRPALAAGRLPRELPRPFRELSHPPRESGRSAREPPRPRLEAGRQVGQICHRPRGAPYGACRADHRTPPLTHQIEAPEPPALARGNPAGAAPGTRSLRLSPPHP